MATRPAAARSTLLFTALVAAGCGADGPLSDSGRDPSVAVTAEGCPGPVVASGRGFVTEPDLVATVAHVVAGASEVEVNGLPAEVVAFDPNRDVAVLRVDNLGIAPADRTELEQGDNAVLLGAEPRQLTVTGRVRIEITDIYREQATERAGFELSVAAATGDSGGPLVDREGRVAGMLFATATAESRRAFAIAMSEIDAVLATDLDAPVDTNGCV